MGGRGTTSLEVVLTRELEVLAILKGAQNVSTLNKGWGGGGGASKSFTLSWGGGGGQKVSDPRFSHFVAPHN